MKNINKLYEKQKIRYNKHFKIFIHVLSFLLLLKIQNNEIIKIIITIIKRYLKINIFKI